MNEFYNRGVQDGISRARNELSADINRAVTAVQRQLQGQINGLSGSVRRDMSDSVRRVDERLANIASVANRLSVESNSGGGMAQLVPSRRDEGLRIYDRGGDIIRIEDIPGRRVPYSMILEIPIGGDVDTVQEDSFMVSQEGPFIAERRYATFLSLHEYEVTDPADNAVATFPGRSFGRFRPISSVYDLNDSQHNSRNEVSAWIDLFNQIGVVDSNLPGAVLALASSASSFRTMSFDGVIEVVVEGASYPRQRRPVPTTFWGNGNGAPFELSALDFFERGESVVVSVTPHHRNNPAFGNATGAQVLPLASGVDGFPFVEGQYDAHEGIATPSGIQLGPAGTDDIVALATDNVVRNPTGIFIVGYEGYRIIQTQGTTL